MLDPDVRAVLDSTGLAHIATISPKGVPHSVPVWIGTRDEQVVFFTGRSTQKARDLAANPQLAISMTAPDNPYQPALLRGHVAEIVDGPEGWAIIDAISVKYQGTPYGREMELVAYVIEPEWQKAGLG